MDDAVPATSPSGSIEREFMLAAAHPKQDLRMAIIGKKSQMGTSMTSANATQAPLVNVKMIIAPWDRRRMPSLETSFEFVKEERPMNAAPEAKARGKYVPRP